MEFGIETKALLFKRMSAYAGLHAIVIKGFCKAKDYKPAEEFVDNRWRNAWNAVYVAGGWRLVQPNWAAMQVNTKVKKTKLGKTQPKLGSNLSQFAQNTSRRATNWQ